MDNLVLPKDMLDLIFIACDLKTKISMKRLCVRTNGSYQISPKDPIETHKTTGVVIYNGKRIKYSFKLKTRDNQKKLKKITGVYEHLMDLHQIANDQEICFTILWNDNNYKKYKCKTINGKIHVTHSKKTETLEKLKGPRYFHLYYDDKLQGRFSSSIGPRQAATKAFTRLLSIQHRTNDNLDNTININFTLKECTKGSDGKYSYFVGRRELLSKPHVVNIGQKMIVYKYKSIIKKREPDYVIEIK